MTKKDETILIRLDSETKENFRKLCETRNCTMTNVIVEQIKELLLDSQLTKDFSAIRNITKERNFYKKELEIYKETYSEIKKKLSILNKNTTRAENIFYRDLFFDNFLRLDEFDGYELSKEYNKRDNSNFILINKTINRKLLVEFYLSSLDEILIGPRGIQYKKLCDKFKDDKELELVIISLNAIHKETNYKVKSLSKKIGYNISIYNINKLFNFLNIN